MSRNNKMERVERRKNCVASAGNDEDNTVSPCIELPANRRKSPPIYKSSERRARSANLLHTGKLSRVDVSRTPRKSANPPLRAD